MKKIDNGIGQRLSEVMSNKGLNQEELAAMINVKQPTISRILNGKTNKSAMLIQIATALDIDYLWLTTGVEPKEKNVELKNNHLRINSNEFMLIGIHESKEALNNLSSSSKEGMQIMLHQDILPKDKKVEDLKYLIATDTAMGGIIGLNAYVVYDQTEENINSGKLYAFTYGGLTQVRYLYLMPDNQIRIHAINSEEYPDFIVNADDEKFELLGKVITVTNIIL